MQRFIGVYIAQASNKGLVEQQRFQLAATRMQHLMKFLGSELVTQGFGPKITKNRIRIVNEPDAPEFARVVERQAQPAFKI